MWRPKRFGVLSLLIGVCAIPVAGLAVHLRSIRVPGSGKILDWLNILGIVKEPMPDKPSIVVFDFPAPGIPGVVPEKVVAVDGVPEMSDAGYLAVNDENAILFLTALSIVLAIVAMATAVWAEQRREPTLYPSVGYLCGSLAIAQVSLLAALVFAIVGITVVLVSRHRL